MLGVRIILDVTLPGVPAVPLVATWIESIGTAEAELGMKPSLRRALKDIELNVSTLNHDGKLVGSAYGKDFKISSITASRTFNSKSPDSLSRASWISVCRWVMTFWKRFSISIDLFSQASYSSGNLVPSSIVRIKIFIALSSMAFERHKTTLSSLECNLLRKKLRRLKSEDTYDKRRRIWAAL